MISDVEEEPTSGKAAVNQGPSLFSKHDYNHQRLNECESEAQITDAQVLRKAEPIGGLNTILSQRSTKYRCQSTMNHSLILMLLLGS